MQPESTFDARCAALAFPLGGIGTGNVSLGARGNLRDWEIFNQPAKGNTLPNTFFALYTHQEGQTAVTRVLEGPIPPPHALSHGYHPISGAGLPRCAASQFQGEYPFAWITFDDPKLPVQAHLEAYTPLIPLNPDDSGIPGAILTYTLVNTTPDPVTITLVGSLCNPVGGIQTDRFGSVAGGGVGQNVNTLREENGLRGLHFTSQKYAPDALPYGSLSLTTDHADVTCKPAWMRGAWWDYLQEFWDDLTADGRLNDLGYDTPSAEGTSDTGSLGLCDTIPPGETRSYRFFLTWHSPNRTHDWQGRGDRIIRNHYATRFSDSWAVADYLHTNRQRLETETRAFHDALFGSTLPGFVLDALSANIVPLRSTTCFWLENGQFFGWEGCFDTAGCCEGTCTHVWSYAQTLAFLFPTLEQVMRRIEFGAETEEDGFMHFRTAHHFRLEPTAARYHAAADGQMGCVLRAYREWQLSGNWEFLEAVWPGIKRTMAFAAREWDADGDGMPEGCQHNTYDIEFYGPNPLCTFYYLAALRAVEVMAEALGEPEIARVCRERFEAGSQKTMETQWNGTFFVQRLDDVDAHKYQHGLGCLSDQLLGQLHAHILGLGYLAPKEAINSAAKAIFDHNFCANLSDHVNCQRVYALNEEAGLLLCTWPDGGRPRFPFPYSDEVWTGIEYQVAALLIYEGWLDAGLEIVAAVQARHDGVRRNRWNEFECGNHYARSMSSWAVLQALSGARFDMARGEMRFEPVLAASTETDVFRAFWSHGRGWGIYTQRRDPVTDTWTPEITVLGGDLSGVRVHACGQTFLLP
jgi:uncharacterized protein (DUF608 family)